MHYFISIPLPTITTITTLFTIHLPSLPPSLPPAYPPSSPNPDCLVRLTGSDLASYLQIETNKRI